MPSVLIIESSAKKEGSYTRMLVNEFIEKLNASDQDYQFIYRDLVDNPIPVLDDSIVDIIRTPVDTLSPEQRQATALSEQLIEELKSADIVVIGSPMYNWSISASLKAWLDQVMRIGLTFAYGGTGVVGLLENKPTLAILARGGSYDDPQRAAVDMQKPYLANVFNVIGLDASFAVMEGSLMGDEARDSNLAKARQVISEFANKIS